MKNIKEFGEYVSAKYVQAAEEYRKAHNMDQAAPLTEEQMGEINGMLAETVKKQTQTAKAYDVFPETIVEAFRTVVPRMQTMDHPMRMATHEKAAKAYVAGQIAIAGGHTAQNIPGLSDAEQLACRFLNREELEKMREAQEKIRFMKENRNRLPREQAEKLLLTNRKEICRLCFTALDRAVANINAAEPKLEDLDAMAMNHINTPGMLTDMYSRNAVALRLITEAQPLLKEMKRYNFEDVTLTGMHKLSSQITDMAPYAKRVEQKVALMADPYYPKIKLEELVNADPKQLESLYSRMKPVLQDHKIALKADAIDQEFKRDPRAMSETDNLLTIGEELSRSKEAVWMKRLARTQGLTEDELAANMIFCDKDGNETEIDKTTVSAMLEKTGGHFYMVSRYGSMDPIPVFGKWSGICRTNDILIGEKAMEDLQMYTKKVPEPRIGLFARIGNWFYQRATGHPTRTMQRYLRDKARFDNMESFTGTAKNLREGVLPEKVQKRQEMVQKRNDELAGQRQGRLVRLETGLKAMQGIKKAEEARFDKVLAYLVVNNSFVGPVNSKLRAIILPLLDIWKQDQPMYHQDGTTETLGQCNSFRDFAWQLREKSPEVVEALKSTDQQRQMDALNKVCNMFCELYPDGKVWCTLPSHEYQERKEALDQALEEAKARAAAEKQPEKEQAVQAHKEEKKSVPQIEALKTV